MPPIDFPPADYLRHVHAHVDYYFCLLCFDADAYADARRQMSYAHHAPPCRFVILLMLIRHAVMPATPDYLRCSFLMTPADDVDH